MKKPVFHETEIEVLIFKIQNARDPLGLLIAELVSKGIVVIKKGGGKLEENPTTFWERMQSIGCTD